MEQKIGTKQNGTMEQKIGTKGIALHPVRYTENGANEQ